MNKTETETGRILKTLVRELSRKESGKLRHLFTEKFPDQKWIFNLK